MAVKTMENAMPLIIHVCVILGFMEISASTSATKGGMEKTVVKNAIVLMKTTAILPMENVYVLGLPVSDVRSLVRLAIMEMR